MKNKFLFAMAFVALIILLTFSVFAETLTFDFNTEESLSWISSSSEQGEYTFDSDAGYMKLKSIGEDPYIAHSFSDGEYLDANTYKYVLYRFKVIEGSKSTMPGGQIFFTSDSITAGAEGSYTSFDMQNTSDWQEVVYDLSKLKWSGKIKAFRLDHVAFAPPPFTVLVHSISFCSTKEEAQKLSSDFIAKNTQNASGPQWIFDTFQNCERFIKNMDQMVYDAADGYLTLTPTGSDPTMTIIPHVSEKFLTDDFHYVAFRMKVTSTVKEGGIFFGTSTNPFSGGSFSEFDVINDGEWHNYVIDMSKYDHKLWTGVIDKIRFDFINALDTDAVIILDRIGVFKTEADANQFLLREIKPNVIIQKEEVIDTGAKVPCWDFRDEGIENTWIMGGGNAIYENGLYVAIPTTTDIILNNQLKEENYFSAEEFHYFALRVKSESKIISGGLFFTNSIYASYNDATYTSYGLKNNLQWQNIIIDMNKIKPDIWKGKITGVRLDPFNPSDLESRIYISRMGFFRSKADANKYLNSANDAPDYSKSAVFKSVFQKAIIPGGTLYDNYVREEFMLSSTTPQGDGENPVVMFTDKQGATSIIALGDTNKYGFTRFVSRKPGTYTLGYNHKNYVDIPGHWGADYVNYVSDRKLFGGTSETEFSPDMTMTRGMFIAVLGRLHGLDLALYDGNTGYSDVNSGEYYAPYIQWSKEFSIIAPVSGETFAPEEPISREVMALAIKNYVGAYGYNFNYYNDVSEFTDLVGCDEKAVNAIKAMQESGIINGKGDNKFDPKGISTRAEVATVMQRVIKAVTGAATTNTSYTNEEITKKRIRLGVWSFDFPNKLGVDQLHELGADLICVGNATSSEVVWNLCDKYGIEIFMNDFPFNKNTLEKGIDPAVAAAEYMDHPSFGGHYFTDEPGTEDFGWIGKLMNYYMEKLPGKIPMVNLLPMYANAAQLKYGAGASAIEYYDSDPELFRKYCQEWFKTNNSTYICTDIYPLHGTSAAKTTYKEYIESINQIATVAREENKEFWCCIQTFQWTNGVRNPNEAEYRWQCYSLLSFGATGLLLWRYTGTSPDFPSLIEVTTQQPTQNYYDCQKVFQEMQKISDIYTEYKNLGAFTHNYTAAVPYLHMTNEYDKSKTIFGEIKCDNPLLFGYFEKAKGQGNAFTVVNMTEFQDGKSSTVQFKLNDMSKKVTSYYRGVPTIITASGGYYTLELECGDGVFVTVE